MSKQLTREEILDNLPRNAEYPSFIHECEVEFAMQQHADQESEKVAVAFAEWREKAVGYSAGVPRQYAIRDSDSKLIYFNNYSELYKHWFEKIYKK